MMNAVALSLVLSSLVTASIRSPPVKTEPIKQDKELIVKEGHRAVEIKYEEDDGSTTIKISPQEKELHQHPSSLFKNVGQSAVEQMCDAYGKCKNKVTGAVGKSKEALSDKAHELKDKVGEVEDEAKHAVGERFGKVKDAVHPNTLQKERGAAHSSKEKLKGVAEEAIKTGNTLQQDVWRNSTETFQIMKEAINRYVVDFLNYVQPARFWASGIMELLGLSLAYGTAAWVTFISSYVMAESLPRPQFAVVQSRIYTVYFRVMAFGIGMALLSHCLSPAKGLIQALILSASLLAILVNLKYVEPRANKLMFETMKLEKEEGRGMPTVVRNIDSLVGKSANAKAAVNPYEDPQQRADYSAAARSDMVKMRKNLRKLNYCSSFLNMITLLSLTWHLVHLGQMLHA